MFSRGPATELHHAIDHEKVMIGRRDVDPPALRSLPVDRRAHGRRRLRAEGLRQEVGTLVADMHDNTQCGRQVGR
jgi:hypothetical protein